MERVPSGPPSYNQVGVIPSGDFKPMTRQEEKDFLEERCAALEKLMPMSELEFGDEVDELTWGWARHLLPMPVRRRPQLAAMKRRNLLRHKEFYQKMRLFKPMAMKYPSIAKTMVTDIPDPEDFRFKLNAGWIKNEEEIAGFTYEDFTVAASSGKFTGWELPKVGDIVQGKVVGFHPFQGAFLDIGDKAWAFVPTSEVSLVPVAKAEEVLKLGQIVEGRVTHAAGHSRIYGDEFVAQMIVSITDLESAAAWDAIDRIVQGEGEESSILQVQVMAMKSFGAVVLTDSGLEALIPSSQLADRAGDTSLVGTKIGAQILSTDPSKRNQGTPFAPRDYALVLSYKNVATKELAEKLEEGMVINATVKQPRDMGLDLMIDGIQCSLRKIDISGTTAFAIPDLFDIGEEIKVYVLSKAEESGEIRLSTRALERKPGEILKDKAGVFERAETTAKRYLERSTEAKKAVAGSLEDILSGPAISQPPTSKPGTMNLDDDDDDDMEGF